MSVQVNARRLVRSSGLLAVSLGHCVSDEPLAAFSACARVMGGAPDWKCAGIDPHAHDRMSIGFETMLHFFSHLEPLAPCVRQCVAVLENCQKGRVVLLID